MHFKPLKSPTRISEIVNKFLEEKKEELKGKFLSNQTEGVRFSIVTDEWSSNNGPRFLNVCLKAEESHNLGLVRVSGSLNAVSLSDMIAARVAEFGLELNQIVGISCDGCSTNVKLGKELFKTYGIYQQLCLAHCIHLTCTDIIYKKIGSTSLMEVEDSIFADEIEDDLEIPDFDERYMISAAPEDEILDMIEDFAGSVGTTREVSKFFKYDRRNQILQEEIMKHPGAKEVKLQLDVPTRWNSLNKMIGAILKHPVREALEECSKIFPDSPNLSNYDWRQIQALREVLVPLEILTLNICKSNFTLLQVINN